MTRYGRYLAKGMPLTGYLRVIEMAGWKK